MAATIVAFALVALVLQTLVPAFAATSGVSNRIGGRTVAAACSQPNVDAQVAYAPPPDFPEGAHPKRPVFLRVAVDADGVASHVDVAQSSGDRRADEAASEAAMHSRYTPAIHNCQTVRGTYLFRAEFSPVH